jgi:hypothetical protein
MRLTLRTLLAYLDDTLAPAEAKLIGQKVAESDTAQELIARIREVTRRRRITTPTSGGPGAKVDPNTIAEYLDNVLPAEALAEVEQLALASDVHLAEIAACHQILTLVLGEQATVPPLAYKRMYELLKPPEADPAHQPPLRRDHEVAPLEGKEVDETLRLGLPILRTGGWRNRVILLGGVTAAVVLLGIAIWQLLPPLTNRGDNLAQGGPGTGTTGKIPPGGQTRKDKKETGSETGTAKDKKEIDPKDKKEIDPKDKKETDPKDKKEIVPKEKKEIDDTPGPPDLAVREIGDYESPLDKSDSVLLQLVADKKGPAKVKWVRLKRGTKVPVPRILSNAPLMSLPGYRSAVKLDSGLRLTLWGNLPEIVPMSTQESLVIVHPSTQVALDVTLKRGRIAVTNPTDRPLKVRLRFHNPAEPDNGEVWEVVLDKDSEAIFNRSGLFFEGEPFYAKSKSPNRVGPMGLMWFVVTSGQAGLKASEGHKFDKLLAPPDGPVLVWTSKHGLLDPPKVKPKGLPDWANTKPPPLPNVDAKLRALVNKALSDLSMDLAATGIDKVLLSTLTSAGDPQKRRLAVRCAGAVDDLERVIDTFKDKDKDVRWTAIETLSVWITHERDNDYRLYEALQLTHGPFESQTIMELLHGFPREQLGDPATWQQMITYLTDKDVAIREIAYWNLWHLVPLGREIPYDAAASEMQLRQAAKAWQILIPPGKFPPQPKG